MTKPITKKYLDEHVTPTGYNLNGRIVKASDTLPDPQQTKRTCPECRRPLFSLNARFLACSAGHTYNNRMEQVF